MDSDQAQKLLEQIRQGYLAEMPTKCDEIENLVLQLKGCFSETFSDLYRLVHSMKGSAGTHGLNVVSTICHELEDRLVQVDADGGAISNSDTDIMLKLVDLVRRAAGIAHESRPDFGDVEGELEAVRKSMLQDLQPVLLIETGYVRLLAQEALSELPVQVVVEEDGLDALRRLLNTRFTCVISANEVKSLNGLAVLSALRASDSCNKKIQAVLLTSSSELAEQKNSPFDYVVSRSASFGEDLVAAVAKAITTA